MKSTYIEFIDRLIKKYEGGYGWNRKDTGGPTKYGITCYDLAEHMGQKMDSMSRWAPIVQAMTLQTAEDIYKTKYADALCYDQLNAGIDVQVMDYGVNSGVARPPRVLRAILGIPGGTTMDAKLVAAANAQDPVKLIEAITAERLTFMHSIRGGSAWKEFGGGWGARVEDLRVYAEHLATAATANAVPEPVAPDLTKTSLPKVSHASTATVSNTLKTAVPSAAASGVGIHEAGLPAWAVGLAMGGVALAGIGFVIYQRQKALALNATVAPPIVLAGAGNAV